MADKLQEIEDKIKQVERKISQVTKHLEQSCQQTKKRTELIDEGLLETKSHLEKALLGYNDEFKLANIEKLSQETAVTKLEQARDEVSSKHAATKKELKKILLSISLILNPIKPIKCATTRASKMEVPIEIEIQDNQLNEIFSKQALVEQKVIKLRSKLYCRAKLQLEPIGSVHQYSQEIQFLEFHVLQENLNRKLELAQKLFLKQCQLKDTTEMTKENAAAHVRSLSAVKNSAKSDFHMLQLSCYQANNSYKSLQLQQSNLWNQVESTTLTGDLIDLSSLQQQQRRVLHSIDQEAKNVRKKCVYLDKRLDYYSKINSQNKDNQS